MGESRAAPVSCSGVDGGNSLQEDVHFKVLHRFYPVYSLIKPLRACLYGGEKKMYLPVKGMYLKLLCCR